MRKFGVDQNVIVESKQIAFIIQSFPVGFAHIFDMKSSGNPSQQNRGGEPANGFGINIRERIGGRV